MANQKSRKLGVFGWKLVGTQSLFYCYFDKYERKLNDDAQIFSFPYESVRYQTYDL